MGLFGNWGEKRKRAICQISTLTMIISSSLPSQKIPRPKNFDCGNSCRVLQLIFRRNPFIHPSTSVIISRADRKSQVRQCLGFCTAELWSRLAYESAEQNLKHCLTWDFLSALILTLSCHLCYLSRSIHLFERRKARAWLCRQVGGLWHRRRRRRRPRGFGFSGWRRPRRIIFQKWPLSC